MQMKCKINGEAYEDNVDVDMFLIDYLRKKGFFGVKRGCDTSNCGLCTVYLDGKPVLSCSVLAVRVDGHEVTTIEGMESEALKLGTFLADEGAEQCGFCSPGLIMNILAMEKELKNPSELEIKQYLSGNLCRCTGYVGQMRAIVKYLKRREANSN